MRGRWFFKRKRRFHRLTRDRDHPFKILNLVTKFMISLYTSEFIQMIKLSLNNFVILRGFKKYYISGKHEFLVFLIIKMISLGGI
jgi:hypothetical protein